MYDIDPPSPVLRLTSPQAGTQPTLQSDQQHLAMYVAGVGGFSARENLEHVLAHPGVPSQVCLQLAREALARQAQARDTRNR